MTISHRGEPHYHTRQHTRPSFHLTGVCLMAVLVLVCSACGTTREYAYIADAERDSAQTILNNFQCTIMPGDELSISVDSKTPENVIQFNSNINRISTNMGRTIARKQEKSAEKNDEYVVDDRGNITFPVLGTLKVAGMTRDSLAQMIQRYIIDSGYVSDPIVTVELENFRVTVIGEVAHPDQIHVEGTRMTIFEALASVGDITIHGRRDNVTIVRNIGGEQQIGEVNLSSKEILNSPYYYLQQNDIVYVEPDKKKTYQSYRNDDIPFYITTTVSTLSSIVGILRMFTGLQRRNLID